MCKINERKAWLEENCGAWKQIDKQIVISTTGKVSEKHIFKKTVGFSEYVYSIIFENNIEGNKVKYTAKIRDEKRGKSIVTIKDLKSAFSTYSKYPEYSFIKAFESKDRKEKAIYAIYRIWSSGGAVNAYELKKSIRYAGNDFADLYRVAEMIGVYVEVVRQQLLWTDKTVVESDELYTTRETVEKELELWAKNGAFMGQKILCNCDDTNSEFYKYFKCNFARLGLKKLVCTCYGNERRNGNYQLAHATIYDGVDEVRVPLHGNPTSIEEEKYRYEDGYIFKNAGSFDSDECIEYLKDCDWVVTNPPFSSGKKEESLGIKLRNLILNHNKKYIIIAPMTCFSSKNNLNGLLDGSFIFGYNKSTDANEYFLVSEYWRKDVELLYKEQESKVKKDSKPVYMYDEATDSYYKKVAVYWMTNADPVNKEYPNYVNDFEDNKKHYKLIKNRLYVDKVNFIPSDYKGEIVVSPTALCRLNLNEWVIVGADSDTKKEAGSTMHKVIIRRK